jgi:hypothetical protein
MCVCSTSMCDTRFMHVYVYIHTYIQAYYKVAQKRYVDNLEQAVRSICLLPMARSLSKLLFNNGASGMRVKCVRCTYFFCMRVRSVQCVVCDG